MSRAGYACTPGMSLGRFAVLTNFSTPQSPEAAESTMSRTAGRRTCGRGKDCAEDDENEQREEGDRARAGQSKREVRASRGIKRERKRKGLHSEETLTLLSRDLESLIEQKPKTVFNFLNT